MAMSKVDVTASVLEMRSSALSAFATIVGADFDLAERVARRVMSAPDVRRPWKDGSCDRSIVEAFIAETGKPAHELYAGIHMKDWTALANFADFRPSHELFSFLADALKEAAERSSNTENLRTVGAAKDSP
jgi:hypothetical protein